MPVSSTFAYVGEPTVPAGMTLAEYARVHRRRRPRLTSKVARVAFFKKP
jgi:hypothetical protein